MKRRKLIRCEVIHDATLYLGDCREILPTISGVDAVVTDPPYGCGKADWDQSFPVEWYETARTIAKLVVIITWSAGLRDTIPLVGDDFIDVIAARNLNGMTHGPMGFGNWLAAVVSCGKPRPGTNAFDFSVSGDMPDHPTPKPLNYMMQLVERTSEHCAVICDPFLGSGTTGVACARLGRKFIGIEIEPKYFDIACRRIEQAYRRPKPISERVKTQVRPKPLFEV